MWIHHTMLHELPFLKIEVWGASQFQAQLLNYHLRGDILSVVPINDDVTHPSIDRATSVKDVLCGCSSSLGVTSICRTTKEWESITYLSMSTTSSTINFFPGRDSPPLSITRFRWHGVNNWLYGTSQLVWLSCPTLLTMLFVWTYSYSS